MRFRIFIPVPLFVALVLMSAGPAALEAQPPTKGEAYAPRAEAEVMAPTGNFAPPRDYFLLRLVGDDSDFRYIPGSLDRAANLQTRLELTARMYRKWTKVDIDPHVYLLNRELWQENRYPEPYGLPLRVGERGLVVPASGDDGTVTLWNDLLEGRMPIIEGFLFRGTAEEAGSMLLSDMLTQRAAGELLVDGLNIEVEQPWMRELAIHIATLAIVIKIEPGRIAVLDDLYGVLASRIKGRSRSVRDFTRDAPLEQWLWFEAQFYAGARTILNQIDPKDAVQALRGMAKKSNGTLTFEMMIRRYDGMRDWLDERFSAVSMVP